MHVCYILCSRIYLKLLLFSVVVIVSWNRSSILFCVMTDNNNIMHFCSSWMAGWYLLKLQSLDQIRSRPSPKAKPEAPTPLHKMHALHIWYSSGLGSLMGAMCNSMRLEAYPTAFNAQKMTILPNKISHLFEIFSIGMTKCGKNLIVIEPIWKKKNIEKRSNKPLNFTW